MNNLDLKDDNLHGIIHEFNYEIKENNTARITGYKSDKDFVTYVIIPKYIGQNELNKKGYLVNEIGDNAFNGCYRLKTVELPNDINIIGKSAFMDCACLYHINTPNKLIKIDDYAFKGCKILTQFLFIKSIEYIGEYSFANAGLTKFFSNVQLNHIGKFAFSNCKHMKSLSLGKSIYLKTIPEMCFVGCKQLKRIKLSDTISSIEENAFDSCVSITEFTLNKNIDEIKRNVFKDCIKLKTIVIESKNFNRINSMAFLGCNSFHTINFKQNIKKPVIVEINAFKGCQYKIYKKYDTKSKCLLEYIKENNTKEFVIR